MEALVERACGLDVHQATVVACALIGGAGRKATKEVKSFGTCQFRFYYGVLPRCSLCPLFDAERAIREGANPPPAMVLEIRLRPHRTLPGREPSPDLDPGWQVPDFPPQAWGEPAAEEPPD